MRASVGFLAILLACGPGRTLSDTGSGATADGSDGGVVDDGDGPDDSGSGSGSGSGGSGSGSPPQECVPGQVIACMCPDGSTGTQTCAPDGLSYDPCECPDDTDTGSDGTDGTSGTPTCLPPDEPYPGDAFIESDDDVVTYVGYSVITGYLQVQGAVTSFEGLECLTLVGGSLYVAEVSLLRDLRGLDNLERVQGELELGMNFDLESLEGLGALNRVGYLSIGFNDSLTSIDGLSALETVDDFVEIEQNHSLPTCNVFSFLNGLTSYAGHCVQYNLDDGCPDEC